MNKNIKRVIALTLAISAYGSIAPITWGNSDFGTKAVYAASYSPSNEQLKSLSIKSIDGDTLDLKDGYNGDKVKLNDDKEYYVKLTDSSDGIKVNAVAEGEDYVVKIFASNNSDATAYNPGDKITLGKGNTTLYIRTYKSLSDYRKSKDDKNDVRICQEEYTLNVKKTTGSSYEDETQDSIYLDKLELNKGKITFLKQRTSYDINVDSSVSEIKITAKPEDSNYRVRVDGSLVDDSDNYKSTVSLEKGKNEVKVKVTDSKDNQRTYTLNITRGSQSDGQEDIYLDTLQLNKGKLEFSKEDNSYTVDLDEAVDALKITAKPEDEEYLVTINGKEVKSSDDYEKEISLEKGTNTIKVAVEDEVNDKKRTYTLTVNRGKATTTDTNNDSKNTNTNTNTNTDTKKPGWVETSEGWKYNDEKGNPKKSTWLFDPDAKVYCYLDENGLRKTGWFKDKEKWYLLDDKGVMLTGWKEKDNKKYFLDLTSGEMLTGWHDEVVTNTDNTKTKNWYYLNATEGSMQTGWLPVGDDWYFLNKNGIMQTGWQIDSNSKYYFNTDGKMVKGTKVIDNKTYKFASSGALIS
jgi:glucan-binding YG repeat protein